MKIRILFFTYVLCTFFTSVGLAQTSSIPQFMAFQGFLSVDTGAYTSPAGGIPASMFLYDDTVTHHEVWSHDYTTSGELVKVIQGYYTVILNFNTDRKNGWDGSFNKQLWLSAIINGQLLNTVRLTSAPYAFNAKIADVADTAISAHNLSGSNLTGDVNNTGNSITVNHATSADNGVPVGTVVAFAGDTNAIDPSWIVCDGRSISVTGHEKLAATLGKTYGPSNNATVYLPNYLGLFLRSVSGNSNVDPDVASRTPMRPGASISLGGVGSLQSDTIKAHSHHISIQRKDNGAGFLDQPCVEFPMGVQVGGAGATASGYTDDDRNTICGGGVIGLRELGPSPVSLGAETRPKNAYVFYIIKVK
jgi:hypothetical protein